MGTEGFWEEERSVCICNPDQTQRKQEVTASPRRHPHGLVTFVCEAVPSCFLSVGNYKGRTQPDGDKLN